MAKLRTRKWISILYTEPNYGWAQYIDEIYLTSFSLQSDGGWNEQGEWDWVMMGMDQTSRWF